MKIESSLVVFMIGLTAWLVFVVSTNSTQEKEFVKFESRCKDKGGITLQAYKNGGEWLGCYKNLIELENEK